jgi:hypothetical protein
MVYKTKFMKNITILLVCIGTLQFLGCRVEADSEEILYQIVNATEHQVSIFFYTIEGLEKVFSYSATIEGKGLLVERIIDYDPRGGGRSFPSEIFEANFAEVVFDNERIEEHNQLEPVRSLFSLTFENVNGVQIYMINEENFNNAILCDGACK